MDLINNQRCNYFPVTKSLVIHRPHKSDQRARSKEQIIPQELYTEGFTRSFFFFFLRKSGCYRTAGESEKTEHIAGSLSKRKRLRKFNKTKYTHSPKHRATLFFGGKRKRTTILIKTNMVLHLRGTMGKVTAVLWVGFFSLFLGGKGSSHLNAVERLFS